MRQNEQFAFGAIVYEQITFFLKDDFLTNGRYLNIAIICQERLSPLTAGYSLVNTAQYTVGLITARAHYRPAVNRVSPRSPRCSLENLMLSNGRKLLLTAKESC